MTLCHQQQPFRSERQIQLDTSLLELLVRPRLKALLMEYQVGLLHPQVDIAHKVAAFGVFRDKEREVLVVDVVSLLATTNEEAESMLVIT